MRSWRSSAASGAAVLLLAGCGHSSAAPRAAPSLLTGDAKGPARGTVMLIHGGGWKGYDRGDQKAILAFPGASLRQAGWRVVSVDYAPGAAGLASVTQAIAREQPECLYGESSGAHLALLAAASSPKLRCVVAAGAPTDFSVWRDEAQAAKRDGHPLSLETYDAAVTNAFPANEVDRWDPVRTAKDVRARVLLVRQRDDRIIPANQVAAYRRADPAAKEYVVAPGDEHWLHGTISAAGREALVREILAFLKGGD
jgi:acetyl esterase/lipase